MSEAQLLVEFRRANASAALEYDASLRQARLPASEAVLHALNVYDDYISSESAETMAVWSVVAPRSLRGIFAGSHR
jgi:hypothetical protein